jgi:hypothetical protein
MKKVLILLLAIFSIGNVCRAQSTSPQPKQLVAGKTLKVDVNAVTPKQIKSPAMAKADATTDSYWLSAQSYYDENGKFNNDNGVQVGHKVDIQFDGDSATITGLVDLSKFNPTATYPIKGYYDSKGKTITISTPTYDSSKKWTTYTQYGKMLYYGSNLNIVFFSGDFTYDETKSQYGLDSKGQLVFTLSDDMSTITSDHGFGCFTFDDYGRAVSFLDFYKAASFTKLTDDVKLGVLPAKVDLSSKFVYPGSSLDASFKLSNISAKDTKYTTTYSDDASLKVNKTSGTLTAGSTQDMTLTLSPQKVGDYSGTITFKADNGNEAVLTVVAKVSDAPEYNKIVKNGSFTFETTSDFPYLVTDTIVNGKNVAVSTNSGDGSMSSLIATFNVPEGQTGNLSWIGKGYGTQPNGVVILLNGNTIISHTQGNHDGIYDASKSMALASGDYTIEFQNEIGQDWYKMGYTKEPAKFFVYDLNLETEQTKANSATLQSNVVDFGRHYFDKLDVIDTMNVTFVNLGSEPLKVTSIKGDANFGGVVPATQATYLNTLEVPVTFTANGIGNYSGNVVISTSAGDFTVNCSASTEKIIYDYSPIIKSGDFSFNTSLVYPFVVEGSKAHNSTAKMTNTKMGEDSWLEASFVVPEGKSGQLAWSGYNSSVGFFTFMGQTILTTGTRISIDGVEVGQYAGEMDASSTTLAANKLLFGAGRHTVKFLYQKKDSEFKGDDKVDVYNLSLTLNDLEANKMSVGATDFSLNTVSVGRKSFDNLMLTNEGSNELKVTEIVPDGDFKGYVPAEGAKTFSTMPVVIYFAPTKEGLAQGNIVVKTTAGDVTVKCKAIATSLDGTPIYDEEFENGYKDWTLVDGDGDGYNFVSSTYQTTTNEVINAHNSNNCLVSVSWDGKLGGLTHAPNNYAISPAITIPADAKQVILDYFFNLRGTETHDVLVGNGSDVSAYKSVFSDSRTINSYEVGDNDGWVDQQVDLSAYAGKTIQLAWRHYESSEYFKFDDVLVYYKTADGINTLDNNSANGTSEIFNANGVKMQTLTKGINIVRTTAADGTVKTRKIVVK